MSSCHLLLGRPLDLFPLLGCHSVQRLVHLLSFILAICPAHLHFCFQCVFYDINYLCSFPDLWSTTIKRVSFPWNDKEIKSHSLRSTSRVFFARTQEEDDEKALMIMLDIIIIHAAIICFPCFDERKITTRQHVEGRGRGGGGEGLLFGLFAEMCFDGVMKISQTIPITTFDL